MGLETATWISDLVGTNPPGTDLESQGANHLRLIKNVLQSTFPVTGKAFNFPTSATKSTNYAVQKADLNTKFVATTSGGAFTFTLPTLVAGDAGWTCEFIKIGSDTNPYFIAPPSGTLQSGEISGLSTSRRCIPGRSTQALWTGSLWLLTRVPSVPIGTLLSHWAYGSLPVGYEWANGQTLASFATNYPDYTAIRGGGLTPDMTGRCEFGLDNVGGVLSNRITVAGGNWDGTGAGNNGGAQSSSALVAHTHAFMGNAPGNVALNSTGIVQWNGGGAFNGTTSETASGPQVVPASVGGGGFNQIAPNTTIPTPTGTNVSAGSGSSYPILPPGISIPKIIVVE